MITFLLLELVMKHGHRFKDITGQRFGRWLVVRFYALIKTHSQWECECDCGTKRIVNGSILRRGGSKSCGCYSKEVASRFHSTHGEARHGKETVEFSTWVAMLGRCSNPTHKQFPDYGGRGIEVCERWSESYENFLADMGRRPEGKYSIHRINNDKGYSPTNCKWATYREQNANKRDNAFLTALGKTQIMIEWQRETGINEATIRARLRRGWTNDLAVSIPANSFEPLARRVR